MDTLQRVKKWLAISLDIREEIITPESTLSELFRQRPQPSLEAFSRSPDSIIGSLSPDSLDIVELVMSLEEEFSLEIPDEEIANLPPLVFDTNTTVAQIVRFIEKNAQA